MNEILCSSGVELLMDYLEGVLPAGDLLSLRIPLLAEGVVGAPGAEPGETVWVPAHTVHRMANKSDRAGRLLEIAFGDFDEADIVRLEDDYAR